MVCRTVVRFAPWKTMKSTPQSTNHKVFISVPRESRLATLHPPPHQSAAAPPRVRPLPPSVGPPPPHLRSLTRPSSRLSGRHMWIGVSRGGPCTPHACRSRRWRSLPSPLESTSSRWAHQSAGPCADAHLHTQRIATPVGAAGIYKDCIGSW